MSSTIQKDKSIYIYSMGRFELRGTSFYNIFCLVFRKNKEKEKRKKK
jgi:hypothetical protein